MAQMIHPQIGEHVADFACGTGGFLTSWLKELDKQVKTADDTEELNNSIYGIEKKQFPYMLCITNMLLHDIDIPRVYHDNSLLKDVLDYTEDDQFDVVLMNPPYGGSEKNEVKNHFPADLASSETADLFMSVNLALGPFFTLIMRQYFEPIHNDSDYKATQIITDHIRKSGVDGIAYRSNYHTGGVNYTIFNSNRESFEFVESKAFMFQSQQHNFCDFDKKMILSTQSQETSGYDAKLSDDILEKLYKRRHPPTWDDFG